MKSVLAILVFTLGAQAQAFTLIPFKTCSTFEKNGAIKAEIKISTMGIFLVEVATATDTMSATCLPQLLNKQIISLECDGNWKNSGSAGEAVLSSVDGVLNMMSVVLPNGQRDGSLFCGM